MSPIKRLQAQLTAAIVDAKPKPIPEAGRLLWSWFLDLASSRSYGPHGPNPISYAEIEAWRSLGRIPVKPHHVALLREMDAAWMAKAREEIRRAAGGDRPNVMPPSSTQAISPTLFDAMFS